MFLSKLPTSESKPPQGQQNFNQHALSFLQKLLNVLSLVCCVLNFIEAVKRGMSHSATQAHTAHHTLTYSHRTEKRPRCIHQQVCSSQDIAALRGRSLKKGKKKIINNSLYLLFTGWNYSGGY